MNRQKTSGLLTKSLKYIKIQKNLVINAKCYLKKDIDNDITPCLVDCDLTFNPNNYLLDIINN